MVGLGWGWLTGRLLSGALCGKPACPIASMKALFQPLVHFDLVLSPLPFEFSPTNEMLTRGSIDLGLAQILPMYDDDTGAEPKIISASFADPFLLLLRDDSSIYLAQCDDDNDLEELEREDDSLLATKWLTGCLYTDSTGAFSFEQSEKGQKVGENIFMFLLSATGALHVSLRTPYLRADANLARFMPCQIFQKQCTLQKVSASYLQSCLRTMQQEGLPRGKYLQRSW